MFGINIAVYNSMKTQTNRKENKMETEKIEKWLREEVYRSMGVLLSDFDKADKDELMKIYLEEKDVRKAVTRCNFS